MACFTLRSRCFSKTAEPRFFTRALFSGIPRANTVRSPDVMVVLPEHLDRVKDTMLLGPADLIIEVVSPDSIGRDRGEKFVEYEALGVSEYWIIDPDRETIEFYQLRDRRYQLVAAEETYRSLILPQVTIEPGILWQKKLPTVRHLLRSWEGL
ncbi:MAG TPA: Uma2 family endonuclease [Fimbriimonas sp.]|nr:Uma2 family endonuclease [Fimbriimonas sp.]